MYIDPKSLIAEIPALQVRDFLKPLHDCQWTRNYLAQRVGLSDAVAENLILELLSLGYIEETDSYSDQHHYQRTLAGGTFSLASAARPLTRQTAQKRLAEFLDRVHAVNADEGFVYCVRRVLVFGSYLTEQERINDIDIAVELVFRERDPKKREAAIQARIRQAYKTGRQFSGFVDEFQWPYNEVLQFLKSRSRAISLHTTDDAILKQAHSQIVFQADSPDDIIEQHD
ncbi:hypothetical protein [Candidatus Amarolinea aalborgensis]|uniref:hypothetical protein n=1 Tax=Candidatus Amarolinea aalborgensis TaxID=2249329 RepID=UPI003BF9833A